MTVSQSIISIDKDQYAVPYSLLGTNPEQFVLPYPGFSEYASRLRAISLLAYVRYNDLTRHTTIGNPR